MISAVVHTYNEEKTIERCLSSLVSWVDEIVIVDMGSTDATCKKASQYKVRIFQHPYTGFVEPARNFGINKVKGQWIIILDSDEEIPRALAEKLLKITQINECDYVRLPRKNIIFGKWIRYGGWWPDFQVRFFKKGAVFWTDKIHGVPLTRGQGDEIEAEESVSIIHYNYQTIEQFIERLNRYTTISAKDIFLSNQHFSLSDLFHKPSKEFINRYFVWEGYKDGLHGLALSLLQSFSELIIYLKLWELENFKQDKIPLDEVRKSISQEHKLRQYWLINELLKQPQNIASKLLLRFKRKLLHYV